MRTTSTNSRRHALFRLAGLSAVIIAGGALLASVASSQSVTPQSVDPWQHFVDCAGVLISAPDVHAEFCLPSNVAPDDASLLEGKDGPDCIQRAPAQFDDLDEECYEDDTSDAFGQT